MSIVNVKKFDRSLLTCLFVVVRGGQVIVSFCVSYLNLLVPMGRYIHLQFFPLDNDEMNLFKLAYHRKILVSHMSYKSARLY